MSLPRLPIVPPLHCPGRCQQLARGRLHARIVLWGCCSNAALMFRAVLNRSCMDCLVRTAKEEGVTKLWSGGEAQCQPGAHLLLLARLPSRWACSLEKSCAIDRCQNDAGVQPPLRRAQLSLWGRRRPDYYPCDAALRVGAWLLLRGQRAAPQRVPPGLGHARYLDACISASPARSAMRRDPEETAESASHH